MQWGLVQTTPFLVKVEVQLVQRFKGAESRNIVEFAQSNSTQAIPLVDLRIKVTPLGKKGNNDKKTNSPDATKP